MPDTPGFLFDVHVHGAARTQLQKRAIDVLHATEVGLRWAEDDELLEYAAAADRIVVTRNYRHFAPLTEAFVRTGRQFAGVLFFPQSLKEADAGGHVRALERWLANCPAGSNPVANTFGWL